MNQYEQAINLIKRVFIRHVNRMSHKMKEDFMNFMDSLPASPDEHQFVVTFKKGDRVVVIEDEEPSFKYQAGEYIVSGFSNGRIDIHLPGDEENTWSAPADLIIKKPIKQC